MRKVDNEKTMTQIALDEIDRKRVGGKVSLSSLLMGTNTDEEGRGIVNLAVKMTKRTLEADRKAGRISSKPR